MIKQLITLTALYALFTSCGIKPPESDYEFVTVPSTGDPILLNSNSRSSKSLKSLNGKSVSINNSAFQGTGRCASLNDLVLSTSKAGSFEWSARKGKRTQKIIKSSIPYLFENCDEQAEQGTYEHASSTVMNQLKVTEKLILEQTDLDLPKVKVRVVPLVKFKSQKVSGKVVTKQDQYLVNNAFFVPSKKELVFLPQGRDLFGRVPFSGIPLWNIPFVISHEYGHHIFNEILGSKVHKKAHICFDSHSHSNATTSMSNSEKATNQKLLGAVNEAFADLIGQLSSGDKFSFDKVNCFTKNRDLNSSTFYDGVKKNLDNKFFSEFLNPSPRRIYSCNQTNYSQIHHFGATIAYGLYQTMKKSDLLNLSIVVDWVKDFSGKFSEHLSVKENLELIINSFAKLAVLQKTEEKDNICNSIKEYFPTYGFIDTCN